MEWYFDFVSPYAYLQFKRLEALGLQRDLRLIPILFAGVLNHWGQRGPAEIPPKRIFTYRHVSWLARSQGVAFKMPEGHPFNPLKLLRLALYGQAQWPLVSRLFDFVWRDGFLPDNAVAFAALLGELKLPDAVEQMQGPEVKATLRSNTEGAIARGVFGVPTIAIGTHLFWGQDATDMALQYRRDPASFAADDRIIAALPVSAARQPS